MSKVFGFSNFKVACILYLICREFKIVETIVIQYKPSAFPAFVPPTLLPQPTFSIGIEKGMHKVITVIFRNLFNNYSISILTAKMLFFLAS